MDNLNYQYLSSRTLIKSSLIALIIAIVILITVILPAEYNIDPTGIGKSIGLTELAVATKEHAPQKEVTANEEQKGLFNQDTTTIDIFAGEGLEYKFFLEQHQKLSYSWSTDKGPLHFDFHGEPQGDTTVFFESYTLASTNKMEGTLTTPFAGSHGWYWRNDTNEKMTISLQTSGQYQIIGLK